MIFDTMGRVITKDKNIIYITRYSFIVNFLFHFSLYFNGLLIAKLLSHPMIMAIGSCLTLIVLFRRKLWTSVNFLIGIMSISDLLVIPLLSSVTIQSYIAQRVNIYEVITYLRHTFMTSSIVSAIIIGHGGPKFSSE
jgi:hypothetical protein